MPIDQNVPTVLIDQDRIQARVAELAAQISAEYQAVDELFLVGVLKGAFIFLSDLTRALTVPHQVDFIALASYGPTGSERGGVRLVMDVRGSITGKHVLVVEDIVDSGRTLEYLLNTLAARKPASLQTCALVKKPSRTVVDVPINYLGFEIPDKWVVGYGLDYKERHRTLPYIGIVEPDA
jgi:hypoxanthine phosphoribosyltransferase